MPEQGVALLRNGQAIEGRITRAGDIVYIVLPEGEIRLKAADVELCCRNLEEGYLLKRRAMPADTVEDHLRLAQWCQRHGLLRAAVAELADARRIDPRHPMIAILQNRLEMAQEPPPQPAAPPAAVGPSFETLDQMVRGLPPGTVEGFTQTIQPILMNHCATAGCHGPQCESKMRLLRIPNGRPATRRQTQRNLYEVLQMIDRERPEASPLLAAAAKPHGAARAAIFNDRQGGQHERLVKWVGEVAGHLEERGQSPLAGTARGRAPTHSVGRRTDGNGPPSSASDGIQPAAVLLPVPNGSLAKPLPAPQPAADQPTAKRPAVQRGAAVEPFGPSDPFDPEVFNRRYYQRAAE